MIKKEERPGPEVAKEIIEKNSEGIKELIKSVQSFDFMTNNTEFKEIQSLLIIFFGGFIPLAIESCSDSIKACTPNMKKKKDASFD